MSDTSSLLPDLQVLQQRAQLYKKIRQFFNERDVLEVETPIFSPAGNPDPNIQNLTADFSPDSSATPHIYYAHTSPEFAMKRLVARGSGCIYQICKVFRKSEQGSLHNPEFSMLEWYRVGYSYHQLMDEVIELLKFLGITQTFQKISYQQLFFHYLSLDILNAKLDELQGIAQRQGIDVVGMDANLDSWRDLLLTHCIEPKLPKDQAVLVFDYPASQAALARIKQGSPELAERFELYLGGIEIANGYQELTSAFEYGYRFDRENSRRKLIGLPVVVIDYNLLADLEQGFPESSGVALGLDRLLMYYLGKSSISNVIF